MRRGSKRMAETSQPNAEVGATFASLDFALRSVAREGTIVGAAIAVVIALAVYCTRCCVWLYRRRVAIAVAEDRMAAAAVPQERAKVAAYIHEERCRVYVNTVYDNIHLPGSVPYVEVRAATRAPCHPLACFC